MTRTVERAIWIGLLAGALIALGVSALWSRHRLEALERSHYHAFASFAQLVDMMEAGQWDDAIDTGRLQVAAHADWFIRADREGNAVKSPEDQARAMRILREDFPELLEPEPRSGDAGT